MDIQRSLTNYSIFDPIGNVPDIEDLMNKNQQSTKDCCKIHWITMEVILFHWQKMDQIWRPEKRWERSKMWIISSFGHIFRNICSVRLQRGRRGLLTNIYPLLPRLLDSWQYAPLPDETATNAALWGFVRALLAVAAARLALQGQPLVEQGEQE